MEKVLLKALGYDRYLVDVMLTAVRMYEVSSTEMAALLAGKPPDVPQFVVHVFNVCHNRREALRADMLRKKGIAPIFRPTMSYSKFKRNQRGCLGRYTLAELSKTKLGAFFPQKRQKI